MFTSPSSSLFPFSSSLPPYTLPHFEPIGPWYFFDSYIDPKNAVVSFDHPIVQCGWAVFTTGIYRNGLFEAGQLHIKRLLQHAQQIGIIAQQYEEIEHLVASWLNMLTTSARNRPLRIKLSLVAPYGMLVCASYIQPEYKSGPASLIPVKLALYSKNGDFFLHPRQASHGFIKTHSYAEYMHAFCAAKEAGFHDTLFVSSHTNAVVETSRSSFWFIDNTTLFLPDKQLGVLDSITRSQLHAYVAPRLNLSVRQWQGSISDIPVNARCYISNCVDLIRAVDTIHTTSYCYKEDELIVLRSYMASIFSSTAVFPCK